MIIRGKAYVFIATMFSIQTYCLEVKVPQNTSVEWIFIFLHYLLRKYCNLPKF